MKHLIIITFILSVISCKSGGRSSGLMPSAKPLKTGQYIVKDRGFGKHSNFNLFYLVNVTPQPGLDLAVRDAIGNGDNLIDVTLRTERLLLPVGYVDVLYVEGKRIKYIQQ